MVYDNTGNLPEPAGELPSYLEDVNDWYQSTGIQFNFCIQYTQNSEWANNANSFKNSSCPNQLGFIDLLIAFQQNGAACQNNNAGNTGTRAWAGPNTYSVAHELGHLLGLSHTFFNSVCFGDSGDGLDDTPFHICDNDPNFSSSEKFNITANPQNWETSGCSIVWENISDECGATYSADHDPLNILLNNTMGELTINTGPGCDIQRDFSFTPDQGALMLSNVNTYLTDYIGSSNTCNLSSVSISGSLNSNETFNSKLVNVQGHVTIDSDVTLDDCTLFFNSASSITVNSGGNLTVSGSTLGQCQDVMWNGIKVLDGGYLSAYETQIFNALTAIDIESNTTQNGMLSILDRVRFRDCPEAVRVTNVGDNSDNPSLTLELIDLNVRQSEININGSSVYIAGGLYDGTVVDCVDASVFTRTASTRADFFNSSIQYHSGPRLQIDETLFRSQGNSNSVNVESCDYLTICRSLFDPQSTNAPVLVNGTAKVDIFLNQFFGLATNDIIHLESGSFGSSPFANQAAGSYIRDNMFSGGSSHIRLSSDSESLDLRCNIHDGYNTAWNIDGSLKDQGNSLDGADNVFKGRNDIANSANTFNYYYTETSSGQNSDLIPDDVTNVDVIRTIGIVGEECQADILEEVEDEWEEYFTCFTDPDPSVICCSIYVPPVPPYPEDYECIKCPPSDGDGGDSGRVNGNSGIGVFEIQRKFEKAQNQNIEKNDNLYITYSPNPVSQILKLQYHISMKNCTVVLYNSIGLAVLDIPIKREIDVTKLSAGLYYAVTLDEFNNIINIQNIVKD